MNHEWINELNIVELSYHDMKAIVSPDCGSVITFNHNDVPILYTGSSARRSGIPILFPFANPLKNDIFLYNNQKIGQHGFARDYPWTVVSRDSSSVHLMLASNQLPQSITDAYPFEFEIHQDISLNDYFGPSLTIQLSVINLGSVPMPIAPGLHPYFAMNNTPKHSVETEGIEGFEAAEFGWGEPLSGSFYPWLSQGMITTHTYKAAINTSKGVFPYCVVWSQNETEVDSDFVCFEPFSRPTDGINHDPILVKNSKPFTCNYTISLQNILS